jgi:hypothetical protein
MPSRRITAWTIGSDIISLNVGSSRDSRQSSRFQSEIGFVSFIDCSLAPGQLTAAQALQAAREQVGNRWRSRQGTDQHELVTGIERRDGIGGIQAV